MNKDQALQAFWSGFDLPAYDVNTVPSDAKMPYITYDVKTDNLDSNVGLTASLWYKSYSWKDISDKAAEIAKTLSTLPPIKIEGGYCWIRRGTPFAQRVADEDDTIRRILLQITVEFLTAY